MMNELIEKIAMQTGVPAATVEPVVGALLAHLSDVLPAPLAHQLAIMLGIHQEQGTADGAADPAAGGLLGGLSQSFGGGAGTEGGFAGASALASVAQSLLGGFLAARRNPPGG